MVSKTTILSLTSRFDVTSLSSCLLKKDLGLLKERYIYKNKILVGNASTEYVTDLYTALQPTTHLHSSSSSFSCLEVSLGVVNAIFKPLL